MTHKSSFAVRRAEFGLLLAPLTWNLRIRLLRDRRRLSSSFGPRETDLPNEPPNCKRLWGSHARKQNWIPPIQKTFLKRLPPLPPPAPKEISPEVQ